jgi:ribose 5-phosphate isomerase B
MRIVIASDHAGFGYKEKIKQRLVELNHEPHDLGTHSTEPVDYADVIRPAALAVSRG